MTLVTQVVDVSGFNVKKGQGMKGIILTVFCLAVFCFVQTQKVEGAALFEEHFPGPDLPSGWNFDTDGQWSIVDGELDQARTVTTPGHADASVTGYNWTNYSAEVRFKFLELGTHDMEAGLILRNSIVTRVAWQR